MAVIVAVLELNALVVIQLVNSRQIVEPVVLDHLSVDVNGLQQLQQQIDSTGSREQVLVLITAMRRLEACHSGL
jgi:hypothetical protein